MNDLIGKLADGAIRPLIHARLPLKDARRAHEMIEARAGDRQDFAEAVSSRSSLPGRRRSGDPHSLPL